MGLLHYDLKNVRCHMEHAHTHIRNDTVIIKAVNQHVLVRKRQPTSVKDGCSEVIDFQSTRGKVFTTTDRFSDTIMCIVVVVNCLHVKNRM
jgi:hypothetical protein